VRQISAAHQFGDADRFQAGVAHRIGRFAQDALAALRLVGL
jgi:hypothetical protein